MIVGVYEDCAQSSAIVGFYVEWFSNIVTTYVVCSENINNFVCESC